MPGVAGSVLNDAMAGFENNLSRVPHLLNGFGKSGSSTRRRDPPKGGVLPKAFATAAWRKHFKPALPRCILRT